VRAVEILAGATLTVAIGLVELTAVVLVALA